MAVFHDSRIDRVALRAYRLGRVREQLRARDYAGILLYDPLNIRYATDTSNMQVWTMHNKVRYAWVPTEGPIVLFDFHGCDHIHEGNEVIGELRPGISYFYFENGPRCDERVEVWADEIAELVRKDGGANRRIAIDKIEPRANSALGNRQLEILDGEEVMELARAIKNELEVDAMMEAIEGCEEGMRRMQAALEPGISENKLWSILLAANIELGGEWIETRLLSSGPRTFPWFRECAQRRIEAGDMVSFDTDLIGPGGYCSDLSRSWLCGDARPTAQQKRIYGIARAQIEHNIGIVRPGLKFSEFVAQSYKLPEEVIPYRYSVLAHGVGLCDEYPAIRYKEDMARTGYDGTMEPGMTLCIESLVGTPEAGESVKLEEQVLVTATGCRRLSTYPYEDSRFGV
jgi:Xaa-Pro aminopeptidase